jgi:hypothetical protein
MFDFVTRVKSLARIEYLNLTFREAATATREQAHFMHMTYMFVWPQSARRS